MTLGRCIRVIAGAFVTVSVEMESRARSCGGRRAFPAATVMTAVALWAVGLAPGAEGADLYPAPGFFAGGLTSASRWEEIRRTSGVVADFPYIGFGSRFVPLDRTCLAEGRLRPLDSPSAGEGPPAREGGRYAISVFKIIPTSINPLRVFLFDKTFEVPACPAQ